MSYTSMNIRYSIKRSLNYVYVTRFKFLFIANQLLLYLDASLVSRHYQNSLRTADTALIHYIP